MELPNDLLSLLRHQLYSPSPLNAISCDSMCLIRISHDVLDIFLVQVRRASRDLRGCSNPEVSCLLPRRYHNRWRTSPASVSSTSRVGSRRMAKRHNYAAKITRGQALTSSWTGVKQLHQARLFRPLPWFSARASFDGRHPDIEAPPKTSHPRCLQVCSLSMHHQQFS